MAPKLELKASRGATCLRTSVQQDTRDDQGEKVYSNEAGEQDRRPSLAAEREQLSLDSHLREETGFAWLWWAELSLGL